MSHAILQQVITLQIGTVEFVSPNEIKVTIDIEAPDSLAITLGSPRPFPRVNGYLLIPVDHGFLVGQVEWITVERSPFPKRRGMQDFGLVDLPYPIRRLSLNPIGTLRADPNRDTFVFSRGSDTFPSIGSPVFLPTDEQLRTIMDSGANKRIWIGTSPLANDAKVCVDPNRLFGRHLAVLGNTGSGKSCSVAGLIRWSLEAAQMENPQQDWGLYPNARFIILDPNGEYSRAFGNDRDTIKARIFKVNPEAGQNALKVPHWFWNSAEWCAFAQASAKTQAPLLRRALREVKQGRTRVKPASEEGKKLQHLEGPDEDVPLPFDAACLADCLEKLARAGNVSQYVDFLVGRIRTLLADPRINAITSVSPDFTLEGWLSDYMGNKAGQHSCLTVLDLSLVPSNVLHLITAVVARMVLEALQRYVKIHGVALPTVLVIEEAHTFIKRYQDDEEHWNAAAVCCQVFERIAREGRKFGLGLVLCSQRPSELSPTVLSQCNTFLLHRISNDRDQKLVHRLLPDNLRGLLRELPSLPTQHAILLGWASEVPVLVRMRDLPEAHRPRSEDPDFWKAWTVELDRGNREEWRMVAEDWQKPSGTKE